MKKLWIFLCFIQITLAAQTDARIKTLEAFEKKRFAAMVDRDISTLSSMLHDDLVYTHSNTTVENKEQFLHAIRSGKYRFLSIETDSVQYHFYGKTAIGAGIVRLHLFFFEKEVNMAGRFTAFWVSRKKQWKLAAWQTTRFPAK